MPKTPTTTICLSFIGMLRKARSRLIPVAASNCSPKQKSRACGNLSPAELPLPANWLRQIEIEPQKHTDTEKMKNLIRYWLLLCICFWWTNLAAQEQSADGFDALIGVLNESNDPEMQLDILRGVSDALR